MTRAGSCWTKLSAFAFLALGAGYNLQAQDFPTRVARLSFISGSVSMQPAGTNEWAAAVLNRPYTTGDYLWTDQGSRAELHLDNSVIRLNAETSFGFLNLDDKTVQIRLAQGELHVHLANLTENESYEVDTPNAAISLLRNGDYRISVDASDQTSFVVVRHGQAEITGGGQAFNLPAGQSAELNGTDTLGYNIEREPGFDEFESFCSRRAAREARIAAQSQYVPPGMIGYEDLYDYGAWRENAAYGWVWYPRVAPGWAPYRAGHWAWIEPWGWTWVDDAPWGFAPFHYGRWAFVGGGWCWTPGPVVVRRVGEPVVRPVYAPALVAFFGGPHFSLSVSFGGSSGLAWVPLGPGEVYAPAYHASPAYFRQVNVSNTVINKSVNLTNVYNNVYVNKTVVNNTVINQRFVNIQAPGAVTAMPQSAFASGRPVAQVGQTVPAAQVARIQTASLAIAPPVAPTRQAVIPSATPGYAAPHPPASVMAKPVVAKQTPPPAPVPFNRKQQFLQQQAGQPLNVQALHQMAAHQPAPTYFRSASATPMKPNSARPVSQLPSAQFGRQQPAANGAPNIPRPPANNQRPQSFEQQSQRNPQHPDHYSQPASQRAVPRPPSASATEPNVREDALPHPNNASPNSSKPPSQINREQVNRRQQNRAEANRAVQPAEHNQHPAGEKPNKDDHKDDHK